MKKHLLSISRLVIVSVFFFTGCKKGGGNPTPSETGTTITSLSVTEGPYDTGVTINGTGFSTNIPNNTVMFNGKTAVVLVATTTHLSVKVPAGAGTGPVIVSVLGAATANGPIFTYIYTTEVTTVNANDGRPAEFGTADNWGIVGDAGGNIYSVCIDRKLRRLSNTGILTVFAGNATHAIINGTGTAASFSFAAGMQMGADGNLYVADHATIRKVTPDAVVTTEATVPGANFLDVVVDKTGNKYATDADRNLIVKITPAGVVSTFAGSGTKASTDGKGTAAAFNFPFGITIDGAGNFYVTDEGSHKIRKITPDGTVTTLAGSGVIGDTNGKGPAASFNYPSGIVADKDGNLYLADFGNAKIRKITPDGTVSTYAGTGDQGEVDGTVASASFWAPQGITIDAAGNIYVSDQSHVRKVSAK
nr:SMP-30/gluconolactonase/LRE family protein [uncultured Mucilaginibacter sp.]